MNRERAEKNSRLGYLKWYENASDLPDGFVVLEDNILALAAQAAAADPSRSLYPAKDIPAYCDNPPSSWEFLGRFGQVRLFRTRKTKSKIDSNVLNSLFPSLSAHTGFSKPGNEISQKSGKS
jgi:hypothetical protein